MVRVVNNRHAGAEFSCGCDRRVNGNATSVVPPAIPGVEALDGRAAGVHYRSCRHVHHARLDESNVVWETRSSVRGDSASIRGHQNVGDVGSDIGRSAQRNDELRRPALKELYRNRDAVDRISVDGHGAKLPSGGAWSSVDARVAHAAGRGPAGEPETLPVEPVIPCSVGLSRPSLLRRW